MTMPMQAGPTPLLSLRALSMRFEKRRSLSDTLARRPQQVVEGAIGRGHGSGLPRPTASWLNRPLDVRFGVG